MKNISIRELAKIVAVLYFGVMVLLFLSVANKFIENQNTEIKIQKELHIANLIGQYNSDLNACLDSARVNKSAEEECIKAMNDSNLAKLIISWGYEDTLITAEELKQ